MNEPRVAGTESLCQHGGEGQPRHGVRRTRALGPAHLELPVDRPNPPGYGTARRGQRMAATRMPDEKAGHKDRVVGADVGWAVLHRNPGFFF